MTIWQGFIDGGGGVSHFRYFSGTYEISNIIIARQVPDFVMHKAFFLGEFCEASDTTLALYMIANPELSGDGRRLE